MDIEGARSYIEAALYYANGSHTFEDVATEVGAGTMQCWLGQASVIITEIVQYPQYRVLNFFLAGGDRSELEAMYPAAEEWGRVQGCKRAVMLARKGWEKTFIVKKEGWTPTLVAFEKLIHG